MRKFFIYIVLSLVTVLALAASACSDAAKNENVKGEAYSVAKPAEADSYTVSGLPETAYKGDTVTFTVALKDPENSAVTGVTVVPETAPSFAPDISDGGEYSFIMPDCPVAVDIEVRTFTEVLNDGGVIFSGSNATRISVNSDNGGYWSEDKYINCWILDIALNWGNYTTLLSNECEIVSSDQSVIPSEAVTYAPADYGNGNMFYGIDVRIDTAEIKPGTTWLQMYFRSGNTSSEGTVCVKITVVPENTVQQTVKWRETVVFELDKGINTENLYFCFVDNNYISGSDSIERQYFYAGQYEIVSDAVTLEIEYVENHSYSVYAGFDNSGESLMLGEFFTDGGSYDDGALTFSREGVTVTIRVYNEYL